MGKMEVGRSNDCTINNREGNKKGRVYKVFLKLEEKSGHKVSLFRRQYNTFI
jgi:hypothetical protein